MFIIHKMKYRGVQDPKVGSYFSETNKVGATKIHKQV